MLHCRDNIGQVMSNAGWWRSLCFIILWDLQCNRNYSLHLCFKRILSWRSADNSLDFMTWFVLWHALCAFLTSDRWSVETGWTWAQFSASWERLSVLMYLLYFFNITFARIRKTIFTLSLCCSVCRILMGKMNKWSIVNTFQMHCRGHCFVDPCMYPNASLQTLWLCNILI